MIMYPSEGFFAADVANCDHGGIDGMYLPRDQLIVGYENISSMSSCICVNRQMAIALTCVKSAFPRPLFLTHAPSVLSYHRPFKDALIQARVGEINEPYTVVDNSIAQPFLSPHTASPSLHSLSDLPCPFSRFIRPFLSTDPQIMEMTTTSQTWVPTQPGTWRMPKHYGVWATAPSTSNPTMTLPIQKNGPTLTATFMDWFVAKVPLPRTAYLRPYIQYWFRSI